MRALELEFFTAGGAAMFHLVNITQPTQCCHHHLAGSWQATCYCSCHALGQRERARSKWMSKNRKHGQFVYDTAVWNAEGIRAEKTAEEDAMTRLLVMYVRKREKMKWGHKTHWREAGQGFSGSHPTSNTPRQQPSQTCKILFEGQSVKEETEYHLCLYTLCSRDKWFSVNNYKTLI